MWKHWRGYGYTSSIEEWSGPFNKRMLINLSGSGRHLTLSVYLTLQHNCYLLQPLEGYKQMSIRYPKNISLQLFDLCQVISAVDLAHFIPNSKRLLHQLFPMIWTPYSVNLKGDLVKCDAAWYSSAINASIAFRNMHVYLMPLARVLTSFLAVALIVLWLISPFFYINLSFGECLQAL